MSPNLVFRCLACKRILKTSRGIEEHQRKIPGNSDVTCDDYKLMWLKPPPDISAVNSTAKGSDSVADTSCVASGVGAGEGSVAGVGIFGGSDLKPSV
jgi:hypothetical protein